MRLYNITILIIIIFFSKSANSNETTAFLDLQFIFNNTLAGKSIKLEVKKYQDEVIKELANSEKLLLEEESKIIAQKNILQPEEFKNKQSQLQKKVITYRKTRSEKNKLLNQKKQKANSILMGLLRELLLDYSKENSISLVIDKKNIILGRSSLEITSDLVKLLDKKVKKIKFN
jgi:Skp family chaperone for outer membrane proteins